jgi:hypothetical protein
MPYLDDESKRMYDEADWDDQPLEDDETVVTPMRPPPRKHQGGPRPSPAAA